MNNSKSPKPTQKTTETSWTLDSTAIVRTRSKSLVKSGPNGINETDLSNELDAFSLFRIEKLERELLEYSNKKMAPTLLLWKTFVALCSFGYGCRAFSKSKGSLE
jgi:hypothetical protein